MPEFSVQANGLQIACESFGPEKAPTVLLIMGLGAQMIRWNIELCERLVAEGYRVIRFDNRDCGRSTRLDQAFLPDIAAAVRIGKPLIVPYTLEDMAADCIGLLDALNVGAAHIVGASLGAAVAQIVAARHPGRTLSLTSIMSSSGNPMLPPPTPAAALALFAPLPLQHDKASIVADAIKRYKSVASPAYPTEDGRLRRMFEQEYDRGFYPPGVARQLGALMANGDRRPLLRTIAAPTVVLHGRDDPLIRFQCGEDVARNIPGADFRLVDGMGHDFPVALSEVFAEAIVSAARHAKA